MIATLIFAGLRREELLWLTHDDMDFSSGNIRIRSKTVGGESWTAKTNKDRRVPISPDLEIFLTEYCELEQSPQAKAPARGRPQPATRPDAIWYFPSPQGRRWDPDNFSQALKRLQKAYQQGHTQNGTFKDWTCLHFRHSFATLLAAKGVSLDRIAKLMGNSVTICDKHYTVFVTEDWTDEVDVGLYKDPNRKPRSSPNPKIIPISGYRRKFKKGRA